MIESRVLQSFLGLAIGATLLGSSVPTAMAESTQCWIRVPTHPQGACQSGDIPANARDHFIFVSTSPSVHWVVRDVTISGHPAVGSGTAGIFGTSRTIFGLVGRYRIDVDGVVTGRGLINNN